MSRKIIFSKRASINLDKLLVYLEIKWSKRVKDNFIKKLDRALSILKDKPKSSQKSETINNLYKCVVTKQTTVFL
jgi:plasmid stabilization system protein ParE